MPREIGWKVAVFREIQGDRGEIFAALLIFPSASEWLIADC